jgi:TRAP-type C4-dicarboxylate transport system substrate-binding protein
MKKTILSLITLALVLSLTIGVIGCPGTQPPTTSPPTSGPTTPAQPTTSPPAETIVLSLGHHWPSDAPMVKMFYEPYAAEIEKRTEGRVKIELYALEGLAPMEEAYNAVISGMADMAELDFNAHPGMFPMHEIVYTNLPSFKYTTYSRNISELKSEFPQMADEFKEVKDLLTWSMGPQQIQANKVIHTPEDANGLIVAAMGDMNAKAAEAQGFSVVVMPPPEVYVALEKHVIDGCAHAPPAVMAWSTFQLLQYNNIINGGGSGFELIMNKDKFDSLSPDLQAIFDETSEWAKDFSDQQFHTLFQECLQAMEGAGMEMVYLSDEELAVMDSRTMTVYDQYVDSLEAKGLPGRAFFDKWVELAGQNAME